MTRNRVFIHLTMNEVQDIQELILDLMEYLGNKQYGGKVSDSTVNSLHGRVDSILGSGLFDDIPLKSRGQ